MFLFNLCFMLVTSLMPNCAQGNFRYQWPKHAAAVMFDLKNSQGVSNNVAMDTPMMPQNVPEAVAPAPPETTTTTTTTTEETTTTTTTTTTTPENGNNWNNGSSSSNNWDYHCNYPPDWFWPDGSDYYYVEWNQLTYSKAKDFCEWEGAHLAHFKTAEEYQKILKYLNNYNYNRMYVGLVLPTDGDAVTCGPDPGDCLDKGLTWSDGSDFQGGDFIQHGISLSGDGGECTVITRPGWQPGFADSDGLVVDPDEGCDAKYQSICQLEC